jgi:predicted Zn-dependent protease
MLWEERRMKVGMLLAATAAMVMTGAPPTPLLAKQSATAPMSVAPMTAKERQAGKQASAGIVEEFGGLYPGQQAIYTEKVGRAVATQSGLSGDPAAFDVTLLNSAVNNAFALPGGYIYSTRQLLALMNDEAELAAVLGHEVAHTAARHSAKRQQAATRNQILGALGQLLVGATLGNDGLGGLLNRGIGTGAQLATLSYSRGQETQADDYGIQYLARAGYDPTAMADVLASLAAQNDLDSRIAGGSRSLPAWASTHPDPASRVARARQQAAALRVANPQRHRDEYLKAIDGMLYGDDPKQGIIEGRDFLHAGLGLGFTAPQGFAMQNGADAVSITGNGAQAQFRGGAYHGSLDTYIGTVLQGLAGESGQPPQVAVQRTSVNGVPAAFASVRASSNGTPVDVTIFAYAPSAGAAYHFVILTAAGQGMGPLAPLVQSFRKLTAAQIAAIKPRYLRVVTVKAGDSVASMAGRMAYDDYPVERFRVLNALDANEALRPGARVKIVTR